MTAINIIPPPIPVIAVIVEVPNASRINRISGVIWLLLVWQKRVEIYQYGLVTKPLLKRGGPGDRDQEFLVVAENNDLFYTIFIGLGAPNVL